jgi:hypothetical protein
MFGLAPKPTYRDSFINRNEEIYEIAKKAKIWYKDYCNVMMDEKAEVISTAKYQSNAHKTTYTKIGDTVYPGVYNWSYLMKWLKKKGNPDVINDLFSLLNTVLGCDDVRKYTFDEAVLRLREHYGDERMVRFYNDYDIRSFIGSHFAHFLFGTTLPQGNNTTWRDPSPLLETRSVSQKMARLSGEILIEFDNESLVERLHTVGTLPTLLDGGIVSVVSLEKWKPDPLNYTKFKEISEQIIPEPTDN